MLKWKNCKGTTGTKLQGLKGDDETTLTATARLRRIPLRGIYRNPRRVNIVDRSRERKVDSQD